KWLVEDLTEAKREKLLNGYEEKKEEETPVAQEAPQIDVPEQVEQAVLPELPPEDEEKTAPVDQVEMKPKPMQESPEASNTDDSATQESSVVDAPVMQEAPEKAPAE
ncbi:MAG: hypothetical protein D3916_08425, partial [Candidatus Electrothrix sp. MAN1_4]|nr:hypothetical protein [Candidatus Electrothrix sp. MAN1_4]